MSFLVRDISPTLSKIVLEAVDAPPAAPSALQGASEGAIWNDITQKNLGTFIGNTKLFSNWVALADATGLAATRGTFTTQSNSTSETVIYASPTANFFTAQPGLYLAGNNMLNVIAKTLKMRFYGLYNSAAAQTLTFKIRANSLTGATLATFGPILNATASITNRPWFIDATALIVTLGATGTWEVHGLHGVQTTDLVSPFVVAGDTNTAAVTGPDLTASVSLVLTVTSSAANASNNCSVRLVEMEVGN